MTRLPAIVNLLLGALLATWGVIALVLLQGETACRQFDSEELWYGIVNFGCGDERHTFVGAQAGSIAVAGIGVALLVHEWRRWLER